MKINTNYDKSYGKWNLNDNIKMKFHNTYYIQVTYTFSIKSRKKQKIDYMTKNS